MVRPIVRALAFVLLISRRGAAEDCARAAPWSRLGDTASHYATPLPLSLTAGSALAPAAFSPTGLDHDLRVLNQRDLGGEPNLEPVSIVTPYALGGVVIVGDVVSAIAGNCAWERRQSAVVQGMGLTFALATGLKFAVGRQWPNAGLDPSLPDRLDHPQFAREFRPFHRFGAWPSGHTSVMFAAAAAFRASSSDLGWPAWLGYPLALGVGAGMWWGDHHWASDIVSGAVLGEAIGGSAGKSFAEAPSTPSVALLPLGEGALVAWTGAW